MQQLRAGVKRRRIQEFFKGGQKALAKRHRRELRELEKRHTLEIALLEELERRANDDQA